MAHTNTLTYREFLDRERKAREIVAAGGVHRDGRNGRYYVESQSGNGTYTVDVYARTCDCPDHQHRGAYCKHIQAAELHEVRGSTEAPERVVLEVEGYVRGRQFLDKKLSRVRVNGGSYCEAKTKDFDRALDWLQSKGYELERKVGPGHRMGTGTARYIYRKAV